MESQPGIAIPEKELGKDNLYKEIRLRKESADLFSKLDHFQSHLSQKDYLAREISRPKEDIHIGDYGFYTRFENDYLFNRIFAVSGFQDSEGDTLTVDRIRKIAAVQTEEYPALNFKGLDGNSADITFWAGRNNTNFGTWLHGYNDNLKKQLVDNLENIPANKWAASMVQEISNHQGEILDASGVYELPLDIFKGDDLNADLNYFLNHFRFGPLFGWQPTETESLLKGDKNVLEKGSVKETTDKEGGKWIVLPTRAIDGITLALQKSEDGVKACLFIDTGQLRGKDIENKFIDSQTGKELFRAMEKLGVKPSEEMLNDLTEGSLGYGHYDSRYGNGYSDLSRLVTYAYREDLGIDKVFDTDGKNISPEDLIKAARDLSEPVKVLLGQIAAVARGKDKSGGSFLDITNFSKESIKSGSCKDSEVYFSSGLYEGKLFREGNFICKSGYGSDTKINIKAITDGNIVFPPGYLFRVSSSGQLDPLRATMFCFDNISAKDAFGWQYEECVSNEPYLPNAIDRFPEGWNVPNHKPQTKFLNEN